MLDFLNSLPGLIMGFREGLEAFLIIVIMLQYLNKTNQTHLKKYVYRGLGLGILVSLVFGLILYLISLGISQSSDTLGKLWESIASFVALGLITTFIIWMIKHGSKMTQEVENKIKVKTSVIGITLLALIMVAREGVEISLFVFAASDKFNYLVWSLLGVLISAGLVILIYKSLVKVNLKLIFNITLIYLILQAGFMLGYAVHELLSYLKATNVLSGDGFLYLKMFDLSSTVLYHKEGFIGIILYVLIGWYSKPEVIQFLLQYTYTALLIYYFIKNKKAIN